MAKYAKNDYRSKKPTEIPPEDKEPKKHKHRDAKWWIGGRENFRAISKSKPGRR